MAPLPLGTAPHPTDAYNVTALLTAAKLVIVGLKPSPKTWYRKRRDESDEQMQVSHGAGMVPQRCPRRVRGSCNIRPGKEKWHQ
jgi:hypothetical protein